jgi:hypothetical protein
MKPSRGRIVGCDDAIVLDAETVRSVMNPDKLQHLGAAADVRAIARQHRQ